MASNRWRSGPRTGGGGFTGPPQPARTSRRSWRRTITVGGLLAATYGVLFSPLFSIRHVVTAGNQAISTETITAAAEAVATRRRWGIFSQSNILLFSSEQLRLALADPRLESLAVYRRPLGSLTVAVTEKTIAGLWQSQDRWYELDQQGYVVAAVPNHEALAAAPVLLPRVINSADVLPRTIGEQVITPPNLSFIQILNRSIPSSLGFSVRYYDIAREEDGELAAHTTEGWRIIFSTGNNLDAQVRKLETFVTEKGRREPQWRKTLEYLDLRFGPTRVYYR